MEETTEADSDEPLRVRGLLALARHTCAGCGEVDAEVFVITNRGRSALRIHEMVKRNGWAA